ncbi:DUF4825 domain-containing protein [Lederbergia wuyishanensis]|uniref:DUF4825 domain-containing protein n=1 Tax=Lederbergia wuyishanensis TaxID=1347903 RepID=A0ABU0DAY9_9BACI|nr:DUF4825 domain-containing protein [Lederbergia wuyishanensis]MCJ8010080.1 DUF4825 domain-containing protein [Lederbergia wuyishanensis]MDQ0345594.1 hypothetical protein [Lederbergia wuyishanensis]
MSKLGKWIIALLVIGMILFITVQFIVIPKQNAAAEQYLREQEKPLTHDLEYIQQHKNPYMGNAGNTTQLFGHLPLSNMLKDFELNSEELTVMVNFKKKTTDINNQLLNQSLIYNSTAAFALIANLEKIEYHFLDQTINVDRQSIERRYPNFNKMTESTKTWNEKVRNPLKNPQYVEDFIKDILP